MERYNRKTVMDRISDIPWGTHLCLFYQTKQDLVDILIPYFKVGLKKDEFCIWITSSPLSEREAKEAAGKAIPNFDQYLKRGQIEIVGHTKWYHKHRVFDLQRTLNVWTDRLNQALASGYEGIRVSGDTAWLEKRDWINFMTYEEEINDLIRKSRIMAICTYSLDKCGVPAVMDVIRCHQRYLIRQNGKWVLLQSAERRPPEEAIGESEEHFRALAEGTSDWLWEIDTNFVFTYASPRVKDLLGYEPEEVIGKTIFEFMLVEEAKRTANELQVIFKAQRPFTVLENKNQHKDGRLVILESSGVPFFDTDGRLLGYRGIDRDITERKQVEKALRDSERRFRDLTESTTDMIWEIDTKGVYTYVNPKIKDVLGYEPEEVIGKAPFYDMLMSPEEAKRMKKKFRALIKSPRPVEILEQVNLHKDGRTVWLQTSAVPFFDNDGRLLGYRGIDRDITERKQVEEALQDSERRFRDLTENTTDMIYELDTKGAYTYINPKIKDVLGYEPEEVIGKAPFYDMLMFPEEAKRMKKKFKALTKSPRPVEIWEYVNLHKDGRTVWLQTKAVPFFDNDGRLLGYRGIDRDITKQKRLSDNMQFYRREVSKAQEEEQKRIARELHDETAQALASLSIEIGEIILVGRKRPEEVLLRLKQLPSRIGGMVEEVRRFSHALRPELLDEFGLIASLELLAKEVRVGSGLSCTIDMAGLEQRISAESELALFRTAQEALRNITKHTKATEVTIRLTFGKERAKIDVIDNGGGFELPEVLSNFARQGKLGLISMNERAQLLGGSFSVESELGKGTKVSIEIPRYN